MCVCVGGVCVCGGGGGGCVCVCVCDLFHWYILTRALCSASGISFVTQS